MEASHDQRHINARETPLDAAEAPGTASVRLTSLDQANDQACPAPGSLPCLPPYESTQLRHGEGVPPVSDPVDQSL